MSLSKKLLTLTMIMGLFACNLVFAKEAMPGLKVGTKAPDFTATTHEGKQVTLSELYAEGPVALIFYRGAWCPYCNTHLQKFQSKISEFEAAGVTILGVSVDLKEYANKTVQENALSFEVISDPQADVLRAYHLMYKVPDDVATKYKAEYNIDLEKHSGRTDFMISIPATYLVDQKGIIQFAFASEDYKKRTDPEDILAVLAKPA